MAKQFNRITREQMFIDIAKTIAKRSTCTRKQVGCVLVIDGRIVATGYNGVLPGIPDENGIDANGNSRTVHAEANAIAFCARKGISTENCILYCTLQPCEKCAELIIQAGIDEVYYLDEYRDTTGLQVLKLSNVKTEKIWEASTE